MWEFSVIEFLIIMVFNRYLFDNYSDDLHIY
jgi:hypothetical protein